MRRGVLWKCCIALAALLVAAAYSPLIIPAGVDAPMLLGMPRTLWAGFLVYGLIVLVTLAGTRVHPDLNHDADLKNDRDGQS